MAGNNINTRRTQTKGIVIHNDAGSMSAEQYKNWLKSHNLAKGFAHYYIDRNTCYNFHDDRNDAWHTGTIEGNQFYVGFEVCQSMSANDSDFLANEQATFKKCAEVLKKFGLQANTNTVRLHSEFSSTSCPHRSMKLHGNSVASVKNYFISQIQKYMGNSGQTVTPQPSPQPPKPQQTSGRIAQSGTCDVLVDVLNIRSAPSTGASIVGKYTKGQTFNYDSYIDAEGIRWVSYVSFSGQRRYVARRTLDNKTIFTTAR